MFFIFYFLVLLITKFDIIFMLYKFLLEFEYLLTDLKIINIIGYKFTTEKNLIYIIDNKSVLMIMKNLKSF